MTQTINWDDLRFARLLASEGSLAAAARQLGVDQTTVARRLRQLEQRLGTALFERQDGHWLPTPLGLQVLECAARIESDVQSIALRAESGAGQISGNVRLTAIGGILDDWLLPRLPALYRRHPELCLELLASDSNLDVTRREADIAIRLARPERGDFLIRKLADVGFAHYRMAGHSGEDWVAYQHNLEHTPEMRRLAERLGNGRIRLRSNSLRSLLQAVRDGIGQGLLPCFLGDREPGLQRLSGPQPLLQRELWLAIHPDARSLPRVAACADWLVECFQAEARALAG